MRGGLKSPHLSDACYRRAVRSGPGPELGPGPGPECNCGLDCFSRHPVQTRFASDQFNDSPASGDMAGTRASPDLRQQQEEEEEEIVGRDEHERLSATDKGRFLSFGRPHSPMQAPLLGGTHTSSEHGTFEEDMEAETRRCPRCQKMNSLVNELQHCIFTMVEGYEQEVSRYVDFLCGFLPKGIGKLAQDNLRLAAHRIFGSIPGFADEMKKLGDAYK
eukprot:759023-Hanusia_phi.AAC.2